MLLLSELDINRLVTKGNHHRFYIVYLGNELLYEKESLLSSLYSLYEDQLVDDLKELNVTLGDAEIPPSWDESKVEGNNKGKGTKVMTGVLEVVPFMHF
jgi:hypothetical protein